MTDPEQAAAILVTSGSSAFRTAVPLRGTASTITCLTPASWRRLLIPPRPRWSDATLITTATSLRW
jgi:hypothetical protein